MKSNFLRNLSSQLDSILISELNARFRRQARQSGLEDSLQLIENRIRQIVEAHQTHTISAALPSVFTCFLQLKENGALYFSEHDLRPDLFDQYADCKSRFDALFAASLNSLESGDLIHLVSEKKQLFEEKHEKIKDLHLMLKDVQEICRKAEQFRSVYPRDEGEALQFLKDMGPLRTTLQMIESRHRELKDDPYVEEPIRQLRQEMTTAAKLMSEQSQKASRYMMDQAAAVFENYKAIPMSVDSMDKIIRQKEALLRYAGLFDSIGDDQRKEKVSGYADVIDAAVRKLQEEISRQKEKESVQQEKLNRDADNAYQEFIEIRQKYSECGVASDSEKKQTAAHLKKCLRILKSHGQRVRSREIERFLNSTGIDRKKTPSPYGSLPEPNLIYKKAFFVLLPITAVLFILVLILIF